MGFADRPQSVWWRKMLFQIHLWIGAFIGLYLILICLTGSLLVFQQRMMDDAPRLAHSSAPGPMTYGKAAALALKMYPGNTLLNIDMRSANRRVIAVGLRQGGDDRIVYVDSASGRIVGEEVPQQKHAFLEISESLHNELATGAKGAVANGVGGALLFVMSLTGIVLWWPGKKNWRRALKVKWNARWARLNWDLHSAFGFWCLLFIAMWGLSGAYFIFPGQSTHALALALPMPHFRETPSAWKPSDPVLPADAFIDKAMRMHPGDKLAFLFMDTHRQNGVVKVFLSRDPTAPLTLIEDVVTLQPATADVLSNFSSANWTLGERLATTVYTVHFGDFGGLPSEIAWALLGFVPVLLTVTGYWMWWNRVLRKKWQRLRVNRPVVSRAEVMH